MRLRTRQRNPGLLAYRCYGKDQVFWDNKGVEGMTMFVAAQTDDVLYEKLLYSYWWKPFGAHFIVPTVLENTMSRLSQSDHTTADQLSNKAREAADHISNKAEYAKERVQDEAGEVKAKAMEAGENAKEHYDDTLESVSGFVRENPLVAIGLAFGAGTLLAAMRRKS